MNFRMELFELMVSSPLNLVWLNDFVHIHIIFVVCKINLFAMNQ